MDSASHKEMDSAPDGSYGSSAQKIRLHAYGSAPWNSEVLLGLCACKMQVRQQSSNRSDLMWTCAPAVRLSRGSRMALVHVPAFVMSWPGEPRRRSNRSHLMWTWPSAVKLSWERSMPARPSRRGPSTTSPFRIYLSVLLMRLKPLLRGMCQIISNTLSVSTICKPHAGAAIRCRCGQGMVSLKAWPSAEPCTQRCCGLAGSLIGLEGGRSDFVA